MNITRATDQNPPPPVPETNREIFAHLYALETALRELIIERLETRAGPYWYKTRLPGDLLVKYRQGRQYERTTLWTRTIPHHPIYYLDFPDLRKIIEKSDNWSEVFKPIFLRTDVSIAAMADIEPIRNKIAHNRKATHADTILVQATVMKIASLIGQQLFISLSNRCTAAQDLLQHFTALLDECESTALACLSYRPLASLPYWDVVKSAWWFDEDYLGWPIHAVTDYFIAVTEYLALPRGRGDGSEIESWVKTADIATLHTTAVSGLRDILANGVIS